MTGTRLEPSTAAPAVARPSGMWASDLLAEAVAGLFARPVRMVLTVLGTVIGLAALVATIGLSRSAANQIVGRFDELAATEITVSAKPADEGARSTTCPGTPRSGSAGSTASWRPAP